MPTSHQAYPHTRLEGLFDHATLLRGRPAPTTRTDVMISTRLVELVIDTVVCLTLGNLEQYWLSAISALAERSGCRARAEVSPRSGTVLTPGRRPRGPLHDATRSHPVSALKRVQPLSAEAEPAGGCCSRGSSCQS